MAKNGWKDGDNVVGIHIRRGDKLKAYYQTHMMGGTKEKAAKCKHWIGDKDVSKRRLRTSAGELLVGGREREAKDGGRDGGTGVGKVGEFDTEADTADNVHKGKKQSEAADGRRLEVAHEDDIRCKQNFEQSLRDYLAEAKILLHETGGGNKVGTDRLLCSD
jgi:hypothetical protein